MAKRNPVVQEILRQGRGKDPRYVAAALETGRIESGFQNLNYGDGDSKGWRQERASLYKNPTDLKASVARFYQEAAQLDKGQPSYDLAADVQRPAAQFRGRYRNAHQEALALMGSSGGMIQQTPAAPSSRTVTTSTPGIDNSALRRQAVGSFLQQGGVRNTNAVLGLAASYAQLKDVPGTTSSRTVSAGTSASTSGPAKTYSAGYPIGKQGKIIGTPYTGTHTLGNWQSDNAVDIATPVGTPMVSVGDGVVVKVRKHPQDGGRFAGDQITVRTADGNEYFYAHGTASVRAGQKIRAGQVLGRTGSANGVAHLHFGEMKGNPAKRYG